MEFSASYVRDLRTSFEAIPYNDVSHRFPSSPSFRKFLQVDMSKDSFEIPTIMAGVTLNYFSNPEKIANTPLYVFPLYVGRDIGIYKTSDSIVRHLIRTSYDDRLSKVSTQSGSIFYGGKGLLLDETFDPLLLCTLKCHKVFQDGGVCKIIMDNPIVHVNPKVFFDTVGLLSKSIVKKVIPYYLSHFHVAGFLRRTLDVVSDHTVVVIDNMEGMFSDAPKGIVSDASVSDALNTFLEENEHLLL